MMTDEQRRKLENEAKSWLQIKINEISLRKRCAIQTDQKFVISFFLSRTIRFY
jgi:hypothetical protein